MQAIILLVIALIVILAVISLTKPSNKQTDADIWPYYAKKPLSQPEQVLYFRLAQALPEHVTLAQVGLSRILGVKKGNNPMEWLNRINRMSADFVVCNKASNVIAVIELDDSSHQREDRKKADQKKDKALASAGIRMIRWNAKEIPDIITIQTTFDSPTPS